MMSRVSNFWIAGNKLIIIFLIISLNILTSCMDLACIDSDDFGHHQVDVPAYYPKKSDVLGSNNAQYAQWIDSGLTLNGSGVHVVVRHWNYMKNINASTELSAWSPWMGAVSNTNWPSLSEISIVLPDCTFDGNQCIDDYGGKKDCNTCQGDGIIANIDNPPCLLRHGIGLYMLLAPPGFNPNSNAKSIMDPVSVNSKVKVVHLGGILKDDFYDIEYDLGDLSTTKAVRTGGAVVQLTSAEKASFYKGKLYFKILDRYYYDNSGQYKVIVKSGVTTSEWDPTKFMVDMVKDYLFGYGAGSYNSNNFASGGIGAVGSDITGLIGFSRGISSEVGLIKIIFNKIVLDSGYRKAVAGLLTMYVIFYAINFLVGNVKVTHHDLVFRVIKILIVSQLLTSQKSWAFFYEYLFTYFINGADILGKIIKDAGAIGPGDTSIISFMLAPHTIVKLLALPMVSLSSFAFGIVYIIFYFIVLMMIIGGLIYASVTQVVCLVMMGLLIIIAPIFISFLLFEKTRSLFDSWLRQMVSFALQPLIIISGITLGTTTMRHNIYQTLGFRVCKHSWFSSFSPVSENALTQSLRGYDSRTIVGYYWKPIVTESSEKKRIPIPEGHFENDRGEIVNYDYPGAQYCEPYMCSGMRYISLPFLDFNNKDDMNIYDMFTSNNYFVFINLLYMIINAIILIMFCRGALDLASFITGGANISEAAIAATRSTQNATKKFAKATVKATAKAAWGAAKLTAKAIKLAVKIAKIRSGIKKG